MQQRGACDRPGNPQNLLRFLSITQLVSYFMAGDKRLRKNRDCCIHLRFSGKRIIITLETKIISHITEQ